METQPNKQNREQDVKIQEVKTNVCWLKKEVTEIRLQVFNHIPTQIGTVKDELLLRVRSLENKILYGFVALIASVIITQVVLKLFV